MSRFALQKPYSVATLPRPIDQSSGRYVVGDVHGGALGSKKRKRSELAIGIDGEGVNLYDISSSRLLTSYALPPQTSFTCPPTSTRTRISKNKVERRTYVSTIQPQAQITLFYESTGNKQAAQSFSETHKLSGSQAPVVYIGLVPISQGTETTTENLDILLVKRDGEVQCLDGNNLQEKWISPASALGQDTAISLKNVQVEFAQLTNAFAASQGILKGREDIFALFSDNSEESNGSTEITEDGFNPHVLFILLKSGKSSSIRTAHIVALPGKTTNTIPNSRRSVKSLLTTILPPPRGHEFEDAAIFSLQASSGTIQQLIRDTVITFDLSESTPREVSAINVPGANSFQRLSTTSIMVSAEKFVSVFNPKYRSIIGSVHLDDRGAKGICKLVSYFPKLNIAVAISDNELVAIQIEGKHRATGLLIDSIGCSTQDQLRPVTTDPKKDAAPRVGLNTMTYYLPGSIGESEASLSERVKDLDAAFNDGNPESFDKLIARNLGEKDENWTATSDADTKPSLSPLDVDKRWIIYGLSKIYSWTKTDEAQHQLRVQFYPPNTFMWLLKTGHMTIANIESALRMNIRESALDALPSGELVNAINELDPSLDFLRILISKTYLNASELVTAIQKVMDSLELFGENTIVQRQLLTNGNGAAVDSLEVDVNHLEEEVEDDLALIEYQLGAGFGVRGEMLHLALSKLYTCPTSDTVYALQTIFTNEQIVSLIYQLRLEMREGAWTSRYLDDLQSDGLDDEAEMSNNSIIIIASLLHNCVDAIGAGGWITGNVSLFKGDAFEAEDLITSLKSEVSAALEAIEEAAYLKGIISEMVRYGDSVQQVLSPAVKAAPPTASGKKRKARHRKPVLVPFVDEAGKMLPFGLKADQNISLLKVGAGGEVYRRTRRDIGHLKSKKVPKYSLERVVV